MLRNSTQHVCSGALAVAALLLASLSNALAAETQQVLVYNRAQLPAAVLAQAEAEAGRILQAAGVEPRWVSCLPAQDGSQPAGGCTQYMKGEPLVLQVAGDRGADPRKQALGYSIVVPEGGTYATVFSKSVAELAAANARGCRRRRQVIGCATFEHILGHAIAHELGHLLTATAQHTSKGLMQADWNSQDLQEAALGKLLFNSDQAAAMQEQVKRRAAANSQALQADARVRENLQ